MNAKGEVKTAEEWGGDARWDDVGFLYNFLPTEKKLELVKIAQDMLSDHMVGLGKRPIEELRK